MTNASLAISCGATPLSSKVLSVPQSALPAEDWWPLPAKLGLMLPNIIRRAGYSQFLITNFVIVFASQAAGIASGSDK
ncbi:MAG: hypothetical protein ACJAZ7_000737 [Zhongshania aliphaticivorans]|jgi:hypothetical protein